MVVQTAKTERLTGRLALLTPEGIRIELTPAGPAVRALAWALDMLVLFALLIAIQTGLAGGLGGKLGQGLSFLAVFVVYWGYPVLCEVYGGGRTLGKRIMRLEVVRADGVPVGWRESGLRNLLLVADFLPFFYLAGLFAMLSDAQFRRLGDLVAGTLVVYSAPKSTPVVAHQDVAPLPLPWPIGLDAQRALLDFVERSERLAPGRSLELADLAEPLTGCQGEASLQRLRGFAANLMKR